jgi:outer membrane protein assembly factor BamB
MNALLLSVVLLASAIVPLDQPAWNVPIDSRTTDQWIAEAPGAVFAARDGRLVALDSATGSTRWTSAFRVSGAPVIAPGVLAVSTDEGLAFIDPSNGHVRIVLHGVPDQNIAGSQSSIVVLNRATHRLCGYSREGRIVWCAGTDVGINGGSVASLGGNLVAVTSWKGWVFYDASNGKAVAAAADADTLVGSDGRYVWFTVLDGGLKGLDLDTNRSVAMHNQIEKKQLIVEHDRAVAVVDGRLKLIDLRTQSMRSLPIDGRWIGGPVDGKIFIERGDGLYLQSIDADARAVPIVQYKSEARYVTSDRAIGYVGLLDGTVLVVDVKRDRLLRRIATGCSFYEGISASGATAIVHCDTGENARLVGFERTLE